ncbi:MAG: O-antigen polymerase [Bacillus sp. (in: firmicutes)]
MIIFTLALILFVLLITPMIYSRKKGGGLFTPKMITLFFLIITNVPYLLTIAADYDVISPLVRGRISNIEINYAISYYVFILIVGVAGLLLGLRSNIPPIFVRKLPVIITNDNLFKYNISILIALFIGLTSYFYFIQSTGGIGFWLQNLYRRASFTTGNSYILSLLGLLNIGVYIYICTFKYKKNIFKFIILLILIIVVSMVQTSLGGRKPTLEFIVFCFLVWHFYVERFKRLPIKMLLLVPLAVLYILIVPIIRSPIGIEYYINSPERIVSEISEEIGSITKSVSYIDHYLLVLDYFSVDNLWWGRSFVDLLYAPIPSKIYPDKPPIDDGVYLRTIAEGRNVTPSTPYSEMYQSSWPPETIGNMYMNFWIPGVFLGMYILGIIFSAAFLYMQKSNFSLYSILIFGTILLNLQISNLRIVQTLTDIILITFFLGILFVGFKKKFKY